MVWMVGTGEGLYERGAEIKGRYVDTVGFFNLL